MPSNTLNRHEGRRYCTYSPTDLRADYVYCARIDQRLPKTSYLAPQTSSNTDTSTLKMAEGLRNRSAGNSGGSAAETTSTSLSRGVHDARGPKLVEAIFTVLQLSPPEVSSPTVVVDVSERCLKSPASSAAAVPRSTVASPQSSNFNTQYVEHTMALNGRSVL
jgi:hypothetical protein